MQLDDFSEQVPLFHALADPTRLGVLLALAIAAEPLTVGEIAALVDNIDTSGVSRHLKVLRGVGVVVTTRDGRTSSNTVNYTMLASTLRDVASAIEACCPTPDDGSPADAF